MSNSKGKLIVALDVPTLEEAKQLVEELAETVDIYKVGSQLFTSCGPVIVRYLLAMGKEVFLDLKFHDIPNTVGNAVSSATSLASAVQKIEGSSVVPTPGLLLLTVHAVGGEEMLKKSVAESTKIAQNTGVRKPMIVGITVLTSETNLENTKDTVLERARLAKKCGLDGVVASSQEASYIREELGEDFIIVTPGIRPQGTDVGDQKRVTTPKEAINNGSDFLVVGRPIVKAENPKKAAEDIIEEINQS